MHRIARQTVRRMDGVPERSVGRPLPTYRRGSPGSVVALAMVIAAAPAATARAAAAPSAHPATLHSRSHGARAASPDDTAAQTLPRSLAPDVIVEAIAFSGGGDDTPGANPPFVLNVAGTLYGWRATLRTQRQTVRVREELDMPLPRGVGPTTPLAPGVTLAGDRALVDIENERVVEADGTVSDLGPIAPGQPSGTYTLRVSIEGVRVAEFAFSVTRPE